MHKIDWGFWGIILGLVAFLTAIVCMAVYESDAPCEHFRNHPVYHVPLRCIK
jgi:hypothetical protein